MTMVTRLWAKLPIALRAVAIGMSIQIVGVMSFGILAQLNLALLPKIPWSLPVELALLWMLFQYLRGRGWPTSTRAVRRQRLRATPIPKELLPATIVTGVALGLTVAFQVVFAYRLVEMPSAAGGGLLALTSAPPLTAVGLILAGVIMTGFVEEAAFRGYMQQPIEQRHGPVVGIGLVAVIFAAVHMPPLAIFPLFVFGALGWGIYARLASSTVPGMVVHATVDAGFFFWVLKHPETVPDLLAANALGNGMDVVTWVAGLGSLVTTGAVILGFVWMYRASRVFHRGAVSPGNGR